jgi:hypothetical protein
MIVIAATILSVSTLLSFLMLGNFLEFLRYFYKAFADKRYEISCSKCLCISFITLVTLMLCVGVMALTLLFGVDGFSVDCYEALPDSGEYSCNDLVKIFPCNCTMDYNSPGL